MSIIKSSVLAAALAATAASATPLTARAVDRPKFGSVPYGVQITQCTLPGKIALTFDDGPAEFTQSIVATLEKNGAKGTFFVNGINGEGGISVAAYQGLVKQMKASGHQIGSHSWSHANFDEVSDDVRVSEIVKNEEAFVSLLGVIPTYWRPPYTACGGPCKSILGEYGYHITDYNLDTKDYENGGVAAKSNFENGINGGDPGSSSFIVLAHDIQQFTADGFVQWMIDTAKAKGFTSFTTIGECLGDPAGNWYRDTATGGPAGGGSEPPKSSTTTSAAPTTTSAPSTSSSVPPSTTSAPSSSSAPTKGPADTTSKPAAPTTTSPSTPAPTTSRPAQVTQNAAPASGVQTSVVAAVLGAVLALLA